MGERAVDQQRAQQGPDQAPAKTAADAAHDGAALGAGGGAAVARMSAAPAVAFTIPTVIDCSKFPTPATRNVAINSSYQQFDVALTAYLGQPFVANWATFGKHASAHVGNEMAAADESLRLVDSLGDLNRLTKDIEHGNAMPAMMETIKLLDAVDHIPVLLKKAHVVSQSAGMALGLFQDTMAEIRAAVAAAHGFSKFKVVGQKLIGMIPHMRAEIQTMKDELADGNRKIYENIAPALKEFLVCVQGAPDGVPSALVIPSDKDGFMTAAFKHYVEARAFTNALRDPAHAHDANILDKRLAATKLANLTLVTHEQMVAQPDYDAMPRQMQELKGRMTLQDPTGVHVLLPAGGNWGNFYERLGYDPAKGPADIHSIDPNNLPPQLAKNDPKYKGSISDYFDQNSQETRLQAPPKQPAP